MTMKNIPLPIKEAWDKLVSEGKMPFRTELLHTRLLKSREGQISFFLVYNEGRIQYYKNKKTFDNEPCYFCSEPTINLDLTDVTSMRLIPYDYPCLPYQFNFASKNHCTQIKREFVVDMLSLTQQTVFKLYYHKPKDSTKLTLHFHLRTALTLEDSALKQLTVQPFIEEKGIVIERLNHTVYGLKVSGNKLAIAEIIYALFTEDQFPLSLVFWQGHAYVFPRSDKEVPSNLGGWKFGSLELIGIFIFTDKELFQNINYERLAQAMSEVNLNSEGVEKVEQRIKELVKNV